MVWKVWDDYDRRNDPEGYDEHKRKMRDRWRKIRWDEMREVLEVLDREYGDAWPEEAAPALRVLEREGVARGRGAVWLNRAVRRSGSKHHFRYKFGPPDSSTGSAIRQWLVRHIRRSKYSQVSLSEVEWACFKAMKAAGHDLEHVNAWTIGAQLREDGFTLKRAAEGMVVTDATLI